MNSSKSNKEIFKQYLLCLTLVLCNYSFFAQATKIRTEGTEFWLSFLPVTTGFITHDNTYLNITGVYETCGTVIIYDSIQLTIPFTVLPNEITKILIPKTPLKDKPKGIQVVSKKPIEVVAVCNQEFLSDASRILSYQTLNTEYMITPLQQRFTGIGGGGNLSPKQFLVIATRDSTLVEVVQRVRGNIMSHDTLLMNKGDIYLSTKSSDYLGSKVKSLDPNKKIAAFSLSHSINVGNDAGACGAADLDYEQIIPLNCWGTEYVTTNIGPHIVLAYAAYNNTNIVIDGLIAENLNAGDFYEIKYASAHKITSDKPIAVGQFMKCFSAGGKGDPFHHQVYAVQHTETDFLFEAPDVKSLNNHELFVLIKNSNPFQIELDGQDISGNFTPHPKDVNYSVASLNITKGKHRLISDQGFSAVYVGDTTYHSIAFASGTTDTVFFDEYFNFNISDDSICLGQEAQFFASVSPNYDLLKWDFGDGNMGYGLNPIHTYSSTGNFQVKLMPDNPICFTNDTVIKTVHVMDVSAPKITGNTLLCHGDTALLSTENSEDSVYWDFGGGIVVSEYPQNSRQVIWNDPGSYLVTANNITTQGCNSLADSILVQVLSNNQPNFLYTSPGCPGLVSFTNTSVAGNPIDPITSYMWRFGDGNTSEDENPTHNYLSPGNYNVQLTVISQAGCEDTIHKPVTIDPFPKLNPINALDTISVICEEKSVQFYAQKTPDATYQWTGPNGFVSSSPNPILFVDNNNQIGWYFVEATLNNGEEECVLKDYDSTYVHFISSSDNPKINGNSTICYLDSVQPLNANLGETFHWYSSNGTSVFNDPTVINPLVTIPNTDTIFVDITLGECIDTSLSLLVLVDRPTNSIITPDSIFVCLGEELAWEASAGEGNHIFWVTPSGDTIKQQTIEITEAGLFHSGIYRAYAALEEDYCLFDSSLTYVEVFPLPPTQLTSIQNAYCPGQYFTLEASGAEVYDWYNNDTYLDSVQGNIYTDLSEKSLSVMVQGENHHGCLSWDTIPVNFLPPFQPDLGEDLFRCSGENVFLSLNSEDFYANPDEVSWNTGEVSESISVSESGIYWVEVMIDGCYNSDTVEVVFQDPAAFSLGNDTLLCEGETLSLNLSGYGGTVVWNDGSSAANRTIAYPGGEYTVNIKTGACELEDDIVVGYQEQHVVSIPEDSVVCLGTVINYSGGTEGNNRWYVKGEFVPGNDLTLGEAGNYDILLVNRIGVCVDSAWGSASVIDPDSDVIPDVLTICENDSILVDATLQGADSYLWEDGGTLPARYVHKAGIYEVEVVYGPCLIEDQTELLVDLLPQVDLGEDQSICENQSLTLQPNVSDADSVRWNDGSTAETLTIDQPGTYQIEVFRGSCSATDQMNLSVDQIPVFDLGPDIDSCLGEKVTIGNALPYPHLWSDGSTADYIQPTESGNYELTLSNGPCSFKDDVWVNFQNPPLVDLGPDTSLCDGDRLILSGPADMDRYEWEGKGNQRSITVRTEGEYSLKVEKGVCEAGDTIWVGFTTPTPPDIPGYIALCEGESYVVDAEVPEGSYLWNDGYTEPVRPLHENGNYQVNITQGPCAYSVSTDVSVYVPEPFELRPDTTVCEDVTVIASTGLKGYLTRWNNKSGENTIWIDEPGTYWVDVIQGPCTLSDTVSVQHLPVPKQPDHYFYACPDGETEIVLDMPEATFEWSTGDTSNSIIGRVDSTYFVTVTNQYGCQAIFPYHVNLDPDCPDYLYVPNAFSPNGDGINDELVPQYGEIQLTEFTITNRWGEEVYRTANPREYWNGMYMGQMVQHGVYIWKVKFRDRYGKQRSRFGHVSVIR